MPHTHAADPRQTLFCRALITLAPSPRSALHAFGQRLIARHVAAQEWTQRMKILIINPPHEAIGSRMPGEMLPPLGLLAIGGRWQRWIPSWKRWSSLSLFGWSAVVASCAKLLARVAEKIVATFHHGASVAQFFSFLLSHSQWLLFY
jgi:hypothetical protein